MHILDASGATRWIGARISSYLLVYLTTIWAYQLKLEGTLAFFSLMKNPWNEILFKEQISGKNNSPQERDRLLIILRHLGSGFRNGLDIKSSAYLHQFLQLGACEKAPACSEAREAGIDRKICCLIT